MLALVMCGGKGKRMGNVEKPMIDVKGKKLIDYALREIEIVMIESVCITSPYVPKTERYVAEKGLEFLRAKGNGYMEDLFFAINELDIITPVLVLNSDLYISKRGVIEELIRDYMVAKTPAITCVYRDGKHVGINVFDPLLGEQKEEKFIIDERDVINIDTPDDLRRAKNG